MCDYSYKYQTFSSRYKNWEQREHDNCRLNFLSLPIVSNCNDIMRGLISSITTIARSVVRDKFLTARRRQSSIYDVFPASCFFLSISSLNLNLQIKTKKQRAHIADQA